MKRKTIALIFFSDTTFQLKTEFVKYRKCIESSVSVKCQKLIFCIRLFSVIVRQPTLLTSTS